MNVGSTSVDHLPALQAGFYMDANRHPRAWQAQSDARHNSGFSAGTLRFTKWTASTYSEGAIANALRKLPPSALRSIPAIRENGASNRSMNERHRAAEAQRLPGLDSGERPSGASVPPPSPSSNCPLAASDHTAHSSSSPLDQPDGGPRPYRVYFNSKADAPNCWSIDDGTIATEIVVASIQLNGVDAISRLNLAANNVNDPRAWFEVYGTLSMVNSHAVIAGA